MENNSKNPLPTETPLDFVFKQDAKFVFTLQEVARLSQALAPFELAASILNNAKNNAVQNGQAVPTFEDDYQKNEDGSFKTNQFGQPILVDDFWEKREKKEKKTILVDSLGNTN